MQTRPSTRSVPTGRSLWRCGRRASCCCLFSSSPSCVSGAARSTRREESAAQVEALASRCRILTAGISTIDFYVRVRDQIERIWTVPQSLQKREGLSHDLWIAALCLENDAPLLTMDKIFGHVEGLRVVRW